MVRDGYFALFALFYRVSRWKGAARAHSASLGASLIVSLLLTALLALILGMLRLKLAGWNLPLLGGVVTAANYWLFIDGDRGTHFVEHLDRASADRRRRLLIVAAVVTALSIVSVFAAGAFYQNALSIHGPG